MKPPAPKPAAVGAAVVMGAGAGELGATRGLDRASAFNGGRVEQHHPIVVAGAIRRRRRRSATRSPPPVAPAASNSPAAWAALERVPAVGHPALAWDDSRASLT